MATGCERLDALSTVSVMNRRMKFAPPFSSVARDPAGGGWPGLYLPVSTPWPMGEKTTWLTPSSSEVGTISPSMTRHSIEYCGWFDISWKPSCPASSWPARIWSAVHSLTPM